MKNKINLASKITLSRIGLSVVLIGLMIASFSAAIPTLLLGALFAVAAATDKLDGYIARSRNQVTDFGKISDAIADKILVTPILFLMAATGMLFANPIIAFIIPTVILIRDMVVDIVKTAASAKGPVVAASNLGKAKTAFMMVGMAILMFGLPSLLGQVGEIINMLGQALVVLATGLSIVSGVDYTVKNKKYLFDDEIDNEKTENLEDIKKKQK